MSIERFESIDAVELFGAQAVNFVGESPEARYFRVGYDFEDFERQVRNYGLRMKAIDIHGGDKLGFIDFDADLPTYVNFHYLVGKNSGIWVSDLEIADYEMLIGLEQNEQGAVG